MQTKMSLEEIFHDLSQKPTNGNTRVFNRYTGRIEELNLSRSQRLGLRLSGVTQVEDRTYEGWRGSIPFFAYTARIAGKKVILFDYKHGFNERLDTYIMGENGPLS